METPRENTVKKRIGITPVRVIVALHSDPTVILPLVHGLKLAYVTRGQIEIIDVRPSGERYEPAKVRRILEQWAILPEGSERADVAQIGLKVKKISKEGNQRKILQKRLRANDHDLLVVGINNEAAPYKLLGYTLPEYCASYFNRETLFFPSNGRSFIDASTGEIALKRIVIPVENNRFYEPAAMKVLELLRILSIKGAVEVTAVHAGTVFPPIKRIIHKQVRYKDITSKESVVEAICSTVDTMNADLVIMVTTGRDTMTQKIIGSNTEQVLRKINCPVWTISIPR